MANRSPLTRRVILTDVNNTKKIYTKMIVDTGAGVSLIVYDLVSKCKIDLIKNAPNLHGAFEGGTVDIIGKITLYLLLDGIRVPVDFFVLDKAQFECLIGWPTIHELKLHLSHKGIFTNEKRVFGKPVNDAVKFICQENIDYNHGSIQTAIYNISISHRGKDTAIDLGDGVFVEAQSGEFRTNAGRDPKITHNFLASSEIVATPTDAPVRDENAVLRAIDDAFKDNKFDIDPLLPENFLEKVHDLMRRYSPCIAISKDEVGHIPRYVEEMSQEFTVEEPVGCAVYPVNPIKADFLCTEIFKLEKLGVIEETKTKIITSNLLAVPKKSGEMRACADLRVPNKYTKPTNLILPRIDQIAPTLMGKKYFIAFDMQKAYWSLTIPKSQRHWYTFQCPKCFRVYQWTRGCMGGVNTGTVYSHMVQMHVIQGLNDFASCYIDDCHIAFDDIQKGFEVFETILKRLVKHNLKIGISKIRLFSRKVEAFGFIFSEKGMKPTDERIQSLKDTPIPLNKKNLLSGLASFNYFRDFIPNFSTLAAELYAQTTDHSSYDQRVVDKNWPVLVEALCNSIQVQRPNYDYHMILTTDASNFGMGMVLSQEIDGKRKIIACHSKALGKSEKLWAIAQKELLAIYTGLVKFESMLFNQVVIIETDNAAVYWLLRLRIGSVEINKRLPAVRCLLYISTFHYEVKHLSGKEPSFLLSDFLSRNGYEIGDDSKFIMGRTSKEPLLQLRAIINGKYDDVPVLSIQETDDVDKLLAKHPLDTDVNKIRDYITIAQLESKFCRRMIENPAKSYKVIENVLYRETVNGLYIVCPQGYTHEVLEMVHQSLHEGIRQTIAKLNYYRIWIFRKYRMVAGFIQNCKKCDPARSRACLKAENKTVARPHQPFDLVHLDLMQVGTRYIILVVDSLSHYIIGRVLDDGTSPKIKAALADIFCHYGIPHTVVQDNAANLNSAVMMQFYNDLGIHVSNSSAFNSRGNSLAELSVLRVSKGMRTYGAENENIHLNLYLLIHKLNLERRPNRRNSAFEIMFARHSSWIFQLPDLSKIRYYAQEKSLKMLYDTANEIRNEQLKIIEKRRNNLTKENYSSKVKKGEHVRLKKFMMNTNKKSFRPFTENVWEVISVNSFTNTCIVREIVEPGYQPRIRRIHKRFIRKVKSLPPRQDDDFVALEPNMEMAADTKPQGDDGIHGTEHVRTKDDFTKTEAENIHEYKKIIEAINTRNRKKNSKIQKHTEKSRTGTKDKEIGKRRPNQKNSEAIPKSSHGMTLRQRRKKHANSRS